MEPTTPAGTPSADIDVSLDTIVSEGLTSAEADGIETIVGDPPAEGAPVEGEAPAQAAAPAAEPAPSTDDLNAARARKILAAAEEKERNAQKLAETGRSELLAGLRASPKATLAKLGLTIDELIDASIAEGDVGAPAAADPVAELRAKFDAQERRDQERELESRRNGIHSKISADPRFPTINAKGAAGVVTDFMVEYYQLHGRPIPWDKAATIVERDLGPSAPRQPAPKLPVVVRPGTSTMRNDEVRTSAPTGDEDPTLNMDPNKALEWLVTHSQ